MEKTKFATNTLIRSVWITLSSSVILFNKHLLDYANFRELPSPSHATSPICDSDHSILSLQASLSS